MDTIMNNQNFTSIFLVDEKFQIIYLNETAQAQCPNARIGDVFSKSYFSLWVTTTCTPIQWPGHEACSLIVGNEIADKTTNSLTQLYEKGSFLSEATRFLSSHLDENYCIIAIDIEHFKLYNEWYGEEMGNLFLEDLGRCLLQAQKTYGGIVGYMKNDDFVILLPHEPDTIESVEKKIIYCARQHSQDIGFRPIFGLYPISGTHLPVSVMYDRAMIAMSSVKGNYTIRDAWYEDIMKTRMVDDQILLSDVQRAIEQNEFLFYAQPKCSIVTGKIIGIESLVRWNHPKRGIIQPGTFIPLLEQCGLITTLDLYVWELVCKQMRSWIDNGYNALPVSVNVSRIDIYSIDIPAAFLGLTQKYSLEPSLIEIEITESSYVQEYEMITKIVDDLKTLGFTVLMDDFGSGYSSLNMLKDVNVDILKMDMMFLHMDADTAGRGMHILRTITTLASTLQMPLIAEGVETQAQADFLRQIGCIYAQGSHYYSPLSVHDFEALLSDPDIIDHDGMQAV